MQTDTQNKRAYSLSMQLQAMITYIEFKAIRILVCSDKQFSFEHKHAASWTMIHR